mgnify:CR=1 FL=1
MDTPGSHLDREVRTRLDEVSDQLETTREEIEQLRNTMGAVAEEAEVSIGPVCDCRRSHLVVTSKEFYCPACGYHRPVD